MLKLIVQYNGNASSREVANWKQSVELDFSNRQNSPSSFSFTTRAAVYQRLQALCDNLFTLLLLSMIVAMLV